jgi:hypothetical protein
MESPAKRLDSWKEIATYLGKDVRTAARWAEKRGLPIHRVPGGGRQSVFAYKAEIDAWLNGSRSLLTEDEQASTNLVESPEDEDCSSVMELQTNQITGANTSDLSPGTKVVGNRLLLAISLVSAVAIGALLFVRFQQRVPQPEVTRLVQLTDDGLPKRRIATDGRNVYFNEAIRGRYITATVPIGGGLIRRIDTPFANSYLLDVSDDGNWLLVVSWEASLEEYGPLWIVSTSGAPARRAGSVICHAAAFSPDARLIVYATGVELWLVDSLAFSPRRIAILPGTPQHPRWSPDGKKIMFSVRDINSADLAPWEIAVAQDGRFSSPRQVADLQPLPCCVDWSWTADLRYTFYGSPRMVDGEMEHDNRVWITRNLSPYTSAHQELQTGIKLTHSFQLAANTNQLLVLGGNEWHYELLRYTQADGAAVPYLPHLSVLYT